MNKKDDRLIQSTPFTHEEFYKRYYVHRVAGAALVVKKDKILLVKEIRRGKYFWGLPGGILEKGEPLIEGVKREVQEETGILVNPISILGLNNWAGKSIFKDDPYNQSGFTIFLGANYVSGDLQPDGEEVIECDFFSINQIDEFEFAPHLVYVKDYFSAFKNKAYLLLSKNELENSHSYRYMFRPSNSE